MSRCNRLHADDLLGCSLAAGHVGLSRSVWDKYRSLGIVPEPAIVLGPHPYWTREQLEEWSETRRYRSAADRARIQRRARK